MSEQALAALKAVREAVLSSKVVCAYCDKVCQDADHLYVHIVLRHKA